MNVMGNKYSMSGSPIGNTRNNENSKSGRFPNISFSSTTKRRNNNQLAESIDHNRHKY